MYFQALETTWFACSKVLIKDASSELSTLGETTLICVLVHIIPKVFINNGTEDPPKSRFWTSPCTGSCPHLIPLLVVVGLSGFTVAVTSTLVMRDKSLRNLVLKQI